MDDEKTDNLTPEESEQVADGTVSDGEEAHRYDEFEDLSGKLDRVLDVLEGLGSKLDAVAAMGVESGAVVTDVDGDGDVGDTTLDQMAEIAGLDPDDLDWSVD